MLAEILKGLPKKKKKNTINDIFILINSKFMRNTSYKITSFYFIRFEEYLESKKYLDKRQIIALRYRNIYVRKLKDFKLKTIDPFR